MHGHSVKGCWHHNVQELFIQTLKKVLFRAECFKYTDIDELGSEQAVKEAGKLRLEGKEYEVQDGDVLHFRFNV